MKVAIVYTNDYYDYDREDYIYKIIGHTDWEEMTEAQFQTLKNRYNLAGLKVSPMFIVKPEENSLEYPTPLGLLDIIQTKIDEAAAAERKRKEAAEKKKKEALLKKLEKDEKEKRALFEALKQEFEPETKPKGFYFGNEQ